MMDKKYFVVFLCFCFVAIADAQQHKTGSWQFHSINQAGLLEGQQGSAFQLQTVNGAEYRSWFGGLGLGLDDYRFRSIPLFFDIRKEFGRMRNRFFIYADAGTNFCWLKNDNDKNFQTDDKFPNRIYADGGIGYMLKFNNNTALLFSAGYSYKKIAEQGYSIAPPPWGVQPPLVKNEIDYHLQRVSIKIGIMF